MPAFMDITGATYGKLSVIKLLERQKKPEYPRSRSVWLCQCACGEFVSATQAILSTGDKQSCGCTSRARRVGTDSKYLYSTWNGIRNRCTNPNTNNYKNYGAVGVHFHQPWSEDFQSFKEYVLSTLGHRPSNKHSIDRIDNECGYVPGNVRWATRVVQNNNTSRNIVITHNGVSRSLSEWCQLLGIRYGKAYERIVKLGWSQHKALGLV